MTYRDDAKKQYDVESGDPAQGYITADDDKAVVDILADEIDKKATLDDLYDAAPVDYSDASGYSAGAVVRYQQALYLAKRDTNAGQSPTSAAGAWLPLSLDAVASKAQHALVPADAKDQVPFGIRVTHPNTDDVLVEVWDAGLGRWQRSYYDSGWRDVLADAAAVANVDLQNLMLRRVGNQCYLRVRMQSSTGDSGGTVYTVPSGFKPQALGNYAVCAEKRSADLKTVQGVVSIDLNSAVVSVRCLTTSLQGTVLSWDVEQTSTIPTSLPGTLIVPAPADEPVQDPPPDQFPA